LSQRSSESVSIWQFDVLSGFDVLCHGVVGRRGGVSISPYDGLNLGLHVGDDPDRVVENRRRACGALGVDFDGCTFAQQVHGNSVQAVTESEAGAGRMRFEEAVAGVDGLVVRGPDITIAVGVADCVPLLLYDPDNHAGAAVHAGWRGTAAGVAARGVEALVRECGSRPESLVAGVGPAIGRCCYQVSGRAVEDLKRGLQYPEPVAERRSGHWYLDLAEANRQQLRATGLRPENIELSGICTSCHSDEFYSERKLGRPTGRFGAFLSLR
jgi:YfiH family protein